MYRPATPPTEFTDADNFHGGENCYPPHSILARLKPARYQSSLGIWPSLFGRNSHEACRATWPFQFIDTTTPLERLRRSLFNLYGVRGFAERARNLTGHRDMLADGFLD